MFNNERVILKPVLTSEMIDYLLTSEMIDYSAEDTLLEDERIILDIEREERCEMLSRLKVMKEMNRRKRTKLIRQFMEQGIPLDTEAMHISYENECFIQNCIDTLKNTERRII